MAPGGFFGQALVVDVHGDDRDGTRSRSTTRCCGPTWAASGWAPGSCTGSAPPRVDPLAPEAPLAFVFSSLVGTPLTTSAKFAVVAKSPLTGLLTDALASSQFAIAGKLTGHDAIVVRGRADELSVLLIDGDGPRLEPAPELAGLSAADAETEARERFGRGWRTAAIGPAGERGVRYATISHDGRHAGRGGLGAVLGAKNIKAVLVKAATKVAVADQAGVLAAAKDLRKPQLRPGHRQVPRAGHAREPAGVQRGQHAAHPQLHCRDVRRGAPSWPPRSCTSCAAWPATAARPARSAASTSTPARAAAASAWSTRTSSRSARCAGCPTRTTCSPPAPAATSWASTRSPRAARSRGPWSASSAA